MWNLENGQLVHTFEGHTGGISALVVTPDNKHVISAFWDKTIKVWNLESGQLVHTFEGHTGAISALVVTPDNKRVISGILGRAHQDVGSRDRPALAHARGA